MTTTREKIGTIDFTESQRRTDHYECAAWFRDYDCPAQTCEVYMTRNPEGWPSMIHYGLNGICVDACLVSLFGGCRIGNDPAGKAAIGQPGTVSVSIYAYKLPANLQLDPAYAWLADQSTWPREIADMALKSAAANNMAWNLKNRFSLDWLKQNGSPEFVAACGI